MLNGTLIWYNPKLGYGFIKQEYKLDPVVVFGIDNPNVAFVDGMPLTYELDPQDFKARNVKTT